MSPSSAFSLGFLKYFKTAICKYTYDNVSLLYLTYCFCFAPLLTSNMSLISANFWTLDQRWFNVVNQGWDIVDRTLKMKQTPTSDFQGYTRLHSSPKLKQRCTMKVKRFFNVAQRRFIVVSTMIWDYLNVVSTWSQH